MTSRIVPPMLQLDRDMQVVRFVAQFECVTAKQLRGVLFSTCRSDTSSDNVLNRLVKQRYLARYAWRYHESIAGGSGSYVYQLGINGWRFIGYEGAYKKLETFSRHKLAIADLFVQLKQAEYAGLLEVMEHDTEPNLWRRIGNDLLKPDLYARIRNLHTGGVASYWFEQDLGTEHERQIREKLNRYVRAWDRSDSIPLVVWVLPNARRKLEVARIIGKLRSSDLALFRVTESSQLIHTLTC